MKGFVIVLVVLAAVAFLGWHMGWLPVDEVRQAFGQAPDGRPSDPAAQAGAGNALRLDFTPGHSYWSPFYPESGLERVLIDSAGDGDAAAAPLAVRLPRSNARPEDRWIEATLRIADEITLDNLRLDVALFAGRDERPLETLALRPTERLGLLSVDMRTHGRPAARVRVDLFRGTQHLATATLLLTADLLPTASEEERIAINIDRPADIDVPEGFPVVFGVPFPRGLLWDPSQLRLVTATGTEIPVQTEVASRWAREGAVQWLRIEALVPATDKLYLEHKPASRNTSAPLQVSTLDDGSIVLDTGAARYSVGAGRSPVREITLAGRPLARLGESRGLYVIDQQGREAYAASKDVQVVLESAGPLAACVRIEGDYVTQAGEALARHITRVEVFAGHPFAYITHTLIITQDTNELWFREVGWELEAMVGSGAQAIFNIARDDPASTVTADLAGGASAAMLQREHRRFGAGEDRFSVTAGGEILAEGAECGDWALLQGAYGALVMGCVESARQHPKEFEISGDRMVLRLFSPRAGEELDFRGSALAEKWNLEGELAETIAGLSPNAAGWSKTHQLLLAPLQATTAVQEAARLAALRRDPVYALADPAWIFASDAMGPLAPRDTERNPALEAVIDSNFERVQPRGHAVGHYGFMNYFAGPTYHGGSGPCSAGRYRFAYGLRNSIWLAYARSGRREIRAFAEGTNRAYLDNYLTHADAPDKTRGVWSSTGGAPLSRLPFFWGRGRAWTLSSSSNLNQFLWDYYLTGYRRARDAVEAYGEGALRDWVPGTRDWRILMLFRQLTQSYGLNWDPALRVLTEATFDSFIQEDSELLLTKTTRPYGSSSYKTREDVRGLIEGWHVFGEPKYLAVAKAVSSFWWRDEIGTQPIGRMRALPHVSALLYEQTGSPAILAGLEAALLRAGSYDGPIGASSQCSIFESLPYAMGTLKRAQQPPAPWIQYRDYGYPSSVVAEKSLEGILDFTVQPAGGATGTQFILEGVEVPSRWGRDLDSIRQFSSGAGFARVPQDAPAGAYQVRPQASGDHFVTVAPAGPLVLYAPRYWHLPDTTPAPRVYFKVSDKARNPQIQFEGAARLYNPEGALHGDPEGHTGWVNLPADQPGLWSFEPLQNRLVRSRNIPPFFAFNKPEYYFEPPIEWDAEAEPSPPPARPDPATVFVPGPSEGRQALYLHSGRSFQLPAGPPHPSGDGGHFLPHRSGTIEFYFRPDWHTFDLNDGSRRFILVQTDAAPWSLTYRIDPEGTQVNLGPRGPSHSLYGTMHLENRAHLRTWFTRQLFERDEWVHIAWSWGPETIPGPRHEQLQLMTMRIFVNGRGRRMVIFRSAVDQLAGGIPQRLTIGPLGGSIANLRISDIHRYTEDFEVPARLRPLGGDRHTRILFPFDGSLEGQSPGAAEPPQGSLHEGR